MTTAEADAPEVAERPTEGDVAANGTERSRRKHRWLPDLVWSSVALATVCAVYTILYARNGRFFYWDDVQHAYTGMSSAIGRQLRDGHWPLDFRQVWLYGMLPADPQYGLFNPVSLLVHMFVSTQEDLARTAYLVAMSYAALAAGGAYTAARAVRCRPIFAAAAAIAVALNIHTLYYLSASWQTFAGAVAWFTWFVAALLVVRRRPRLGPLAIVPTYLFMTSGYPHAAAAGVAVAAIVLGSDLVRRVRPWRDWVPMISGLASGALLGALPWLLALAYVPYIHRPEGTGISNDGRFIVHAESLVLSFSPFDRPFMINFGGTGFTDQPITYFVWTIPAAVALFVLTRRRSATVIALGLAAVFIAIAMAGPAVFGPIRWPFRFTPFAAALAVLAATTAIDRAGRPGALRTPTTLQRRAYAAVATALLLLAVALRPDAWVLVGTAALLGLATPGVIVLARRSRSAALGGILVAGTAAAALGVAWTNPELTELPDWGGATTRSEVANDVAAFGTGRALVLLSGSAGVPNEQGDFIRRVPSGEYPLISPDVGEYIGTGHAATPIEAQEEAMCAGPYGWVCPEAPRLLFTPEPETGQVPVDLMDVDRIIVQRGPVLDTMVDVAPTGWQATQDAEQWVLFERTDPSPAPSSTISWADDSMTVDAGVGDEPDVVRAPNGGRLTLSRPWTPGLQVKVDGHTIDADSLSGIYPVVELPASTDGELTVYYRLPRLRLLLLAVVAGLAAGVLSIVTAVRSRRTAGAPGEGSAEREEGRAERQGPTAEQPPLTRAHEPDDAPHHPPDQPWRDGV